MGKELISICFDVLSRHVPGGRLAENRTGYCYVESWAPCVIQARLGGQVRVWKESIAKIRSGHCRGSEMTDSSVGCCVRFRMCALSCVLCDLLHACSMCLNRFKASAGLGGLACDPLSAEALVRISMLRPSWAATQEFPNILWNPKVHYHIRRTLHRSLSLPRPIQSMPPHPIALKFISAFFSLHLDLPSLIFWEVVGLERGSLSLVSIIEELLEWKSSGSGSRKSRLTAVGIRCADHATPSIRKSWH
jgi:hypothetical protein